MQSVSDILSYMDAEKLKRLTESATQAQVEKVLSGDVSTIEDFAILISPFAQNYLELMAQRARKLTRLRFGSTVKLYVPLYISNSCVNACKYCGFNIRNRIDRHTLTIEQVRNEARHLSEQGFRHLLLVSGESQKDVPVSFIAEVVREIADLFAAITIEVYPMSETEYRQLAEAGVTGITIYQETYDREIYSQVHEGPKADYDYRLMTPDRAAQAGFREVGIGSLLGLADYQFDLVSTAVHARYLMKKYWRSQVAVSFPRLRSAEGGYQPAQEVSDRQLAQAVFALRLLLPDAELVLSTRESAAFRDGMAGVGITRMSAGSKTSPGGYVVTDETLEQFEVADERSVSQVASMLLKKGLEPVWKDFDTGFIRE